MATAACESRITYIDGDAGVLLHRGYPIEQLAVKSSFLEVAYLLTHGELPSGRTSTVRPLDPLSHDAERDAAKLLQWLSLRRASDGDGVRGRGLHGGVLSRLHGHQ